jgi:hypothetical protein
MKPLEAEKQRQKHRRKGKGRNKERAIKSQTEKGGKDIKKLKHTKGDK